MPEPPTAGRILPGCIVLATFPWGARVRWGDYRGKVHGPSAAGAAVGDRMRVLVREVEGNEFIGSRAP